MKKIILALMALALVSCGKQNAETPPQLDTRLVGTSYKTTDVWLMTPFGKYGHVFEFDTATSGIAYWTGKDGKQNGTDGEFTYTLDYPKLTIKTTRSSDGRVSTNNFVFSDTRSFYREDKDGTRTTYYKQ